MNAVLSVNNLRLSYPTRKDRLLVLDGVDLSVRQGEFLSLIGPSGCGKTTFLHLLNGLIAPLSGSIDGSRDSMAMVFQRPHLLPWRTVFRNAIFGLECVGDTGQEGRSRTRALLERMGLGKHLEDYPHQLSEGMKQRVNLARALLVRPNVLLMDEPFSSVDVMTRRSLQNDLLSLWKELAFTVILVSHSLEEVVYMSDRIGMFTDKPATISEVVDVDLPRPRCEGPQATLKFLEKVHELEAKFRLQDQEGESI